MDETYGVKVELPKYKCHKEVYALRIDKIRRDADERKENEETDGSVIVVDERAMAQMELPESFIRKHGPLEVGGYIVVYADGYKSYSPAKVFEEGYTRI